MADFEYGPPAWVDWKGIRWYYYHRLGRYRDRNGIPLAQAVWADGHGPIPEGYDVHHINGVKTDDRPENLELRERWSHRAEHAAENGAQTGMPDRRKGAEAMWSQREPIKRTCRHCGAEFESRATYASYCSPAHRAAFGRDARRKRLGIQ